MMTILAMANYHNKEMRCSQKYMSRHSELVQRAIFQGCMNLGGLCLGDL